MATAAIAVALVPTARAVEVPGPPKVELPPPAAGLPDPPDPPYFAPLEPAPPPGAGAPHPRLLFGAADLPSIRARIADPASVPGQAWAELRARVDAAAPTAGGAFGRDDAADAAFVWLVTGERAYLDTALATVRAQAVTPGYGAPLTFDATEYYNRRAHILNGLALAWDWLHDDLPPAERAQLQGMLVTLGQEHFAHSLTAWWGTVSTGSNFTGNNGAAVGMAGLSLFGDVAGPAPGAWLARGRQLVLSYFQEGFDATGAGYEGILYGNYGLRIPTMFAAALTRAGDPNPLRQPHVRRQNEWFAYEVLPGGGALNPLNDARYGELNEVHVTWASTSGAHPELAGWIFDHRPPPGVGEPIATMLWHRPPSPTFSPEQILPLARSFPGRGLVHVRSGWGGGDLMASFEARHNDWGEGVHQNQDVNSFVLYAAGARLVIDSGYANYVEKLATGADFEAARSSETEAHNYIEVDGRSQDFHGKGRLRTFVSTAVQGDGGSLDLAAGDARLAYLTAQPQRADRWFLHVRAADGQPAYVVTADAFRQDAAAHTYTSYLHTEPGNAVTVLGPGRARFSAPNGGGAEITTVGATPLTTKRDTFTADYDEIGAHPRLVTSSRTAEFDALTVLVPTAPGEVAPAARGQAATGGIAVAVAADVIVLRTRGAEVATGDLVTDGELAYVRPGGSLALGHGTRLSAAGVDLARLTGGPGTVVTSPARVVIEGPAVTGARVFAPTAGAVVVNGEPVAFARCGDDVVVPARSC